MLRGQNLEFLASQLMKATNSVSQNGENGPVVVVEFDFHVGPTVPHVLEFVGIPEDESELSHPVNRLFESIMTIPGASGSSQKGVIINQKPEL